MDLLWPGVLLLLGGLPLIIAAYLVVLRRRKRFAVRFSSLSLVRAALPRYSQLWRHLPFALFMLALASLVLALARPVATVTVPSGQATIILAMDVSRSMLADDIPPSRLDAAAAAALKFVEAQDPNTQIGIVGFAGFAEMVQAPTNDQQALREAILSLTTGRGTAIGSGILRSLDVIAEIDSSVAPIERGGSGIVATPVPEGYYVPAIIVLLTDGVTTTGPLPLDTAQEAIDRGVRVYTIGFGTQMGGQFGGGGGGRFRRGIDEETLERIADMTGGAYYVAESAGELQQVFSNLPASFKTKSERTEITVAFAAVGALLATLAIGMSLYRHALL
jgi:Ca-activated chloride channel homolog